MLLQLHTCLMLCVQLSSVSFLPNHAPTAAAAAAEAPSKPHTTQALTTCCRLWPGWLNLLQNMWHSHIETCAVAAAAAVQASMTC
jgi:hypothetical protein